jgi:hypothetical protein
MKVIREFTRMAAFNLANGLPVVPTPLVSMVTSFLTYHRLKERGGKPVGGQSLDDIYAFAQEHLLTDQSPRNQGGCVHEISKFDAKFDHILTTGTCCALGLLGYQLNLQWKLAASS